MIKRSSLVTSFPLTEGKKEKAKKSVVPKKTAEPKTFSLHWGSGIIEEEVQVETPYHRPTIQLFKFTDGEAKGDYEIRFCFYDHKGRFQRSPVVIGSAVIPKLRKALERAPK